MIYLKESFSSGVMFSTRDWNSDRDEGGLDGIASTDDKQPKAGKTALIYFLFFVIDEAIQILESVQSDVIWKLINGSSVTIEIKFLSVLNVSRPELPLTLVKKTNHSD